MCGEALVRGCSGQRNARSSDGPSREESLTSSHGWDPGATVLCKVSRWNEDFYSKANHC